MLGNLQLTSECAPDRSRNFMRSNTPISGRPQPDVVVRLRNELHLNWSQIARKLDTSARTVRRMYFENPGLGTEASRRGRPFADVSDAEVVRLRESGMSWRAIGKKLATAPTTVREVYDRALNTTQAALIEPTPCDKSAKHIPASEQATDAAPNTAEGKFDTDQGGGDGLRAAAPEARFRARRSRLATELLADSSADPDRSASTVHLNL